MNSLLWLKIKLREERFISYTYYFPWNEIQWRAISEGTKFNLYYFTIRVRLKWVPGARCRGIEKHTHQNAFYWWILSVACLLVIWQDSRPKSPCAPNVQSHGILCDFPSSSFPPCVHKRERVGSSSSSPNLISSTLLPAQFVFPLCNCQSLHFSAPADGTERDKTFELHSLWLVFH